MQRAKLPRYITLDKKWYKRPYKVSVYRDGKSHYVRNFPTLDEALTARDEYCGVHGVEIVEKGRKLSSTTY